MLEALVPGQVRAASRLGVDARLDPEPSTVISSSVSFASRPAAALTLRLSTSEPPKTGRVALLDQVGTRRAPSRSTSYGAGLNASLPRVHQGAVFLNHAHRPPVSPSSDTPNDGCLATPSSPAARRESRKAVYCRLPSRRYHGWGLRTCSGLPFRPS